MRGYHRETRCENLEDRIALTANITDVPTISFDSPIASPTGTERSDIQAAGYADLNDDGKEDIVFGTRTVRGLRLALGKTASPAGTFTDPQTIIRLPEAIEHIAIRDFNNDGVLDVIAAGSSIPGMASFRLLISSFCPRTLGSLDSD